MQRESDKHNRGVRPQSADIRYASAAELVQDVQDLKWLGQGE